MKRPMYYILKGKRVFPAKDVLEWGRWFEKAHREHSRHVGDVTIQGVRIGTVFMGLDHGYSWMNDEGYRPLLFETMVFGGGDEPDGYQQRYSTWGGAEHGHKKVVEMVKATLTKPHDPVKE
jgi:hypothetical protein